MIVLVVTRGVPVAPAQAGVGAPVGQTVSSEVVDGERRAGRDLEVRQLPQVVVVLG